MRFKHRLLKKMTDPEFENAAKHQNAEGKKRTENPENQA